MQEVNLSCLIEISSKRETIEEMIGLWKKTEKRGGVSLYRITIHSEKIGLYLMYTICQMSDKKQ